MDLVSSQDTYLNLLRGNGTNGAILSHDDDGGLAYNSSLNADIIAGSYTIEVTTKHQRATGRFVLAVGAAGTEGFKIDLDVIQVDDVVKSFGHLGGLRWKIWTSAVVRLAATKVGVTNLSGYEFEVVVPRSTGLQIGSGTDSDCVWDWTGRPTSIRKRSGEGITLVRCGIGDGESVIEVKAWKGTTEFVTDFIMPVVQSWHRADNVVRYESTYLPPNTFTVNFADAVKKARDLWNKPDKGITFCDETNSECNIRGVRPGTIAIRHYNPLVATTMGNHCDTSYACVSYNPSIGYPHLTVQNLYIEQPPTWDTQTLMWTDDPVDLKSDERYLTRTFTHEFGHAAGLGHSPSTDHVMGPRPQSRRNGQTSLHDADEKAMKAIYHDHSNH